MKKKVILIATMVAIITGVIFLIKTNVGTPRIYWENDARVMFKINSRDFVNSNVPGSSSMTKVMALRGILNMRVLDISDSVVKVAMQFSPIAITMSKKRFQDIEQLYSRPFFVDIAKNGALLNFYFDNNIARDDEKNIIETVKYVQFIIRKNISSTWHTNEKDNLGSYTARYFFKDKTLHKKIVSYDPMVNEDGYVDEKNRLKIKKSNIRISYGKPNVWFSSIVGNRLATISSDKHVYMRMSSTFEIHKITFQPDLSLAIWKMGNDYAAYIAQWKLKPKNHISIAKQNEITTLQKHFGGISLQTLGNKIFSKFKTFDSNAVLEIVRYLQLYPEKVKELYPFLLSTEINEMQKAMIMHALIKTGHSQAQQALSEIMTRTDFSKSVRIQAAMAFGEISKCDEQTVSNLIDFYNNRQNVDETGKQVAIAAILSLGTISRKLKNSINEEDKHTASRIKSKIMTDLSAEQNIQSRVSLLYAAGNTAQKEFVKPISSYLKSDNPRLRSTAANALKHIDDGQVNSILRDRFSEETNPNVRGAILVTLNSKKADQDTVDQVISSLKKEDNEIVRGHMYQYLLKNRNEPGVKKALEDMLQQETSYKLRKTINRALATRK